MKKVINIIFIILALGIILVPVIFINREPDKKSDRENRYLAQYPTVTITEPAFKSQFENWFNDNIGLRDDMLDLRSSILFNGLNIVSSEKVHRGTDGWFFYTLDNNLDIATGDYPLSQEQLELIAEKQQALTDYYRSMGKEYILMITPSKASIYSEYLQCSDKFATDTAADIVTDYIIENTNVTVYNAKDALLEAKKAGVGQLFHKTDTHWNERGSYYVYRGLHKLMVERGILDDNPIDVTFSDGMFKGEFSNMLGNSELLPEEYAPIANWTYNFSELKEGELYSTAVAMQKKYDQNLNVTVYGNDNVGKKILQIYGDSQLMPMRKIPLYLSENFSNVINYYLRTISAEVDLSIPADVVIYSCGERYINTLLQMDHFIPYIIHEIPELPDDVQPYQKESIGGTCIAVNGEMVGQQIILENYSDSTVLNITGWACDFKEGKALSAIYLVAGDRIMECNYGIESIDVSDYFNNENFSSTRMSVTIPLSYLDGLDYIEFILVGNDGTYRFENARYTLVGNNKVYSENELTFPATVRPKQSTFYSGMCLDKVNDKEPTEIGLISRDDCGDGNVVLIGWAADFSSQKPLSALYAKVGERIIKCSYGIKRDSVAEHFENNNLLYTGFNVSFPAYYLDNIDTIEFIQIGSDVTYMYEPVTYTLKS